MNVRLISPDGIIEEGYIVFRHKRSKMRSVTVSFNKPLTITITWPKQKYESKAYSHSWVSTSEEFYLVEYDGAVMVWGQGCEFPNYSWRLHKDDREEIIKGGGA